MVSSQQTRDLECFADSSSIPWNPPTIHCQDLTATAPQMSPSYTLRNALSAIPFVADLCGVDVQWFRIQSFPRERTGGVSSRSITVTNKSNSLTCTVASSLVCTSPWAVITVVGLLDVLMVSKLSRVKVFLAYHVHSSSWIHDKLSSLRLFCWRSREDPFFRGRVECSLAFLFEIVYVLNRTFRIDSQDFLHRVSQDCLPLWEINASESCETQPNCGTFFTKATAFLSSLSVLGERMVVLFLLFVRLFVNLVMREQTLIPCLTSRFVLKELTFGLVQLILLFFDTLRPRKKDGS